MVAKDAVCIYVTFFVQHLSEKQDISLAFQYDLKFELCTGILDFFQVRTSTY